MKKENMNLLDGMNYQGSISMPALEVRETVRHHGNKKRLVLLIILLICTLSLLGSATYAWFTANKLVRVEDMQIQVQVANGLQISSDAQDWKQAISLDDLYKAAGLPLDTGASSTSEDAGAINQFPTYLHNISSIGNISQYHKTDATSNNNRLELYTGVAASVCDVPKANPTRVTDYDTVSIGNGETIAGSAKPGGGTYGLEDCIIGRFCYDLNGDGTIDEATECDKLNHGVSTGLVDSHPYTESRTSCRGTGEQTCQATVDTIAFDLYLKLDEPSNIKLAQGSSVTRIGADNLGLENTIRVAFVTLGTQPYDYYYAADDKVTSEGKGKTTCASGENNCIDIASSNDVAKANKAYNDVFGGFVGKYGARTMNAFGSITIWEPNNAQHTKAALQNASQNYKLTVTETQDVTTHGIYGDMSDPDDGYLPLPLTLANKDEMPDKFAPQEAVTDFDAANLAFDSTGAYKPYKNNIGYIKSHGKLEEDGSKYLFAAPKGVTKVRVYIWVEGNDIDTENNATASKVNASLLFTSAAATAEKAPTFAGDTANSIKAYEVYHAENQIPIADDSLTWRESPDVAADTKKPYTPPTAGGA